MTGFRPTADSLATLLRLLDDETPAVRHSVAGALDRFDGDVSELLGETPVELNAADHRTLSELLLPARRARLRREWVVPAGGIARLGDDWDGIEALLRMLSDYLHDGVTLRLPLADALDLLVEETEEAFDRHGAPGIFAALLRSGRLRSDPEIDLHPSHYDLAAAIHGEPSNAVGIGMIVLLVSRRLGASVSGLNLPGSFFCRTEEDVGPLIVAPGERGQVVDPAEFAHRIRRFPRDIRLLASRPATPGELLMRLTEDLASAFAVHGMDEDAALMEELVGSLIPT